MSVQHALFLGVLQGLTEFFPISSSGHLVLAELLLNLDVRPADMLGFNVFLHGGTLAALLIVYARTWLMLLTAPWRRDRRNTTMLVLLIVATIPAAIIGFLFEDVVTDYLQSSLPVGIAFAGTGLILLLGEHTPRRSRSLWHRLLHPIAPASPLTVRTSLFIGFAQALALVPGLSRSGLTISAGRLIGLERRQSLDFSFLMAVPIIAGATALSVIGLLRGDISLPSASVTIPGVAASFVASIFAILFLRTFAVSRSLAWFAPYLFLVAAVTVTLASF